MILTRRILIQMAIFALIATTALAVMLFGYMRVQDMAGVGQYTVKLELPETGGLYPRSNVTPRGAPGSGEGPSLKDGDVIPADRATVPTDINKVLTDTTRGLQAIPQDNLKTVVDEAYTAVGGLGPELRRLVNGSTTLAIDARKNLDPLTTLIDQSKPVLDSQTETAGSIQAWASNLAIINGQLQRQAKALA